MTAAPPRPPASALASSLPSLAALAASMISVQVGASFAKGLFPAVGPQGATALRVVLAALILAAIYRPWRSPPQRRAWPVLAAYGATLGLMNLLFYSALQTIPLGVAVALEFTGPLGVAVLATRRRIDFAWVALAATGLLALAPLGHQAHPLDPKGIAFALGAGLCWGLYIVFGKQAGTAHGAQATAIGMIVAALVAFPFGLAQAGAALFAPQILLSAIGVAIASSVLPYTMEMFALTRMPVRVFGTLMSLEPALAALMGWLILHEALAPRQAVAIAAIMLASLGATLTMDARREAPRPLSTPN
ncbi:EamA family transporter [Phenylobacterium hankyongense]|uniref:EamA family transporter n=1 Tax=Phenylobacterium hankyongense TaxID=1813876 RepID=A0A328AV64_9CAUL|nr:EamA family transporter [Phenylobacterium hankyongense]RAK58509.1 EamA family transporter [Phenylobacterium hankyongense]